MKIKYSQEVTVLYTLISDDSRKSQYFATRKEYLKWWKINSRLICAVQVVAH